MDFDTRTIALVFALVLAFSKTGPLHAKAPAPTPGDYVVVVTDGRPEPGSWYISAKHPWGRWFEEMEKYDFLIVHLPFGNDRSPMQFCSRSQLEAIAADHPHDHNLAAKADVPAFTAALRHRTNKGLWTGVYFGGLDTLQVLEGETAEQWYARAMDELKPVLEGKPDALFFDDTQGPEDPGSLHDGVVWGVGKGAHLLFNELARRGIEVAIEPCTYEDYPLLHKLSVLLTDQWWYGREFRAARRKELNVPGGGDSLWDTGSFAKRPLRPADEHPRVYRLVYHRAKADGEYERLVRLARRDGHIPCVRWLDIRYGEVDMPSTKLR